MVDATPQLPKGAKMPEGSKPLAPGDKVIGVDNSGVAVISRGSPSSSSSGSSSGGSKGSYTPLPSDDPKLAKFVKEAQDAGYSNADIANAAVTGDVLLPSQSYKTSEFVRRAQAAGYNNADIVNAAVNGTALLPSQSPRTAEFVNAAKDAGYNNAEIANAAVSGQALSVPKQNINNSQQQSNQNGTNALGKTSLDSTNSDSEFRSVDASGNNSRNNSFRPGEIQNPGEKTFEVSIENYKKRQQKYQEKQQQIERLSNFLTGGYGVPFTNSYGIETPVADRSIIGRLSVGAVNTVLTMTNPLMIGELGANIIDKSVLVGQGLVASPRNTAKELFIDAPIKTGTEVAKLVTTAEGLGSSAVIISTLGLGVLVTRAPKVSVSVVEGKSISILSDEGVTKFTKSTIQAGNKELTASTTAKIVPDIENTKIVSQYTTLRDVNNNLVGVQKAVGRVYQDPGDTAAVTNYDMVGKVNKASGKSAVQYQGKATNYNYDVTENTRANVGVSNSKVVNTKTSPVTSPQDVTALKFGEVDGAKTNTLFYGVESDVIERPVRFAFSNGVAEVSIEKQAVLSKSSSKSFTGKPVADFIKQKGMALEDVKVSNTKSVGFAKPRTESSGKATVQSLKLASTFADQETIARQYAQVNQPQAKPKVPVSILSQPKETEQQPVQLVSAPTQSVQKNKAKTIVNEVTVQQSKPASRTVFNQVQVQQQSQGLIQSAAEIFQQLRQPARRQQSGQASVQVQIQEPSQRQRELLEQVQVQQQSIQKRFVTPLIQVPMMKLVQTPRLIFAPPQGFDVLVRRNGVFQRVNNQPLTKADAINMGAYKVAHSAAATFEVEDAHAPASARFFGIANLNDFLQKNSNTWMQKLGKRIQTPGEKQDITYKGIQASRNKRTGKNPFGGRR